MLKYTLAYLQLLKNNCPKKSIHTKISNFSHIKSPIVLNRDIEEYKSGRS